MDKLPLMPPGVPGTPCVFLHAMGKPASTRPLMHKHPTTWAEAERWLAMAGRMYGGHQVGLVELCFTETGREWYGPAVLLSARATDVPNDPTKEN